MRIAYEEVIMSCSKVFISVILPSRYFSRETGDFAHKIIFVVPDEEVAVRHDCIIQLTADHVLHVQVIRTNDHILTLFHLGAGTMRLEMASSLRALSLGGGGQTRDSAMVTIVTTRASNQGEAKVHEDFTIKTLSRHYAKLAL